MSFWGGGGVSAYFISQSLSLVFSYTLVSC